jgi:histidyl-tRNA synthetase
MLGDRSAAPIQRVRGTNDVLPPADARLRRLEAGLRHSFERFGYQGIQTPILEPLELFLRKSGDEIVARMYAFSHWNRRLCLRPELTASVMRAFVDDMQGHGLPKRLHYAGPSFRYERPSRGRSRQFTQVGVELIGASGAAADAEVLHLACAGLEAVGIKKYRLVVGHLAATLQLLAQLGMTDHAQGLVLDQMEPVARGRIDLDAAVARVVDRLGGGSPNGSAADASPRLPSALASLPPEQATAIATDILSRASLPLEGGARQPHQIIQRLLAKAKRPDPTDQVRAAFEFVAELRAAAGQPARLERELRPVLEKRGLSTAPVDEVSAALDFLLAYGPLSDEMEIEVDLSLARGLRYYTGLVFEIYVDGEDGPLQVCGGGRYDDLVRALGGREPVPACGFSYGLERVELALGSTETTTPRPPHILVVGVEATDHPLALGIASDLRSVPRLIVEQDVRLRGVKSALRYADRASIDLVVIVGQREREDGTVVMRDMRSRHETVVPRTDLLDIVQRQLG